MSAPSALGQLFVKDLSLVGSTPNDSDDFVPAVPTVMVRHQNVDQPIENELRDSYLTYAMSVIVSRALPDVRDGLKPSQRRFWSQ